MRPRILDLFRVELYVKVSTMIRVALKGITLQTTITNKKQIERGTLDMQRDEFWSAHRARLCFRDRNMDLGEWAVAVGEQPSLAGHNPYLATIKLSDRNKKDIPLGVALHGNPYGNK
jgi:hypothetical protein